MKLIPTALRVKFAGWLLKSKIFGNYSGDIEIFYVKNVAILILSSILEKGENARAKELLIAALDDDKFYVQSFALQVLARECGYQPTNDRQRAILAVSKHDVEKVIALGAVSLKPFVAQFLDQMRAILKEEEKTGNTLVIKMFGADRVEKDVYALKALLEKCSPDFTQEALMEIASFPDAITFWKEIETQGPYDEMRGSDYELGPGLVRFPAQYETECITVDYTVVKILARRELEHRRNA